MVLANPTFDGASSPRLRRLLRYASTSVVSTVVSELTLVLVYATGALAAAPAAVVATSVGGLVSYPLSRYWIWPEGDRRRVGRQALAYWLIMAAGMVASAWATGEVGAHVPYTGLVRVVMVGVAYLAVYGALWVVKYIVYQSFVFRPASREVVGRD